MEGKTIRKLFLDDEREPKDAYAAFLSNNNPIYLEEGWTVVRSIMEFMRYLKKEGVPDVVSFDHDLGPTPITGFYCAKQLIDFCEAQDLDLPKCLVHSANPVGKKNIQFVLDNYSRFRKTHAQKIQEA